jgi:hypothetical protein
VLALVLGLASCGDGTDESASTGSPFDAPRPAATRDLSPAPPMLGTLGRPTSSHAPAPEAPRCLARSLSAAGPIDARSEAAIASCVRVRTGQEKLRCGEDGRALADTKRLEDSVPPLDDRTRARILKVARRGRELGRNPKAFGLVGDSITVSRDFMGALSKKRDRPAALDDFAADLLRLESGGTVIDRFRGAVVERRDGDELDSFAAFRAAKIGASAGYATEGAPDSPIAELLRRVNPAIAVVTFGANDAAARGGPPNQLADAFEGGLMSAVATLEDAGVVVILSNEMRHGDQPGVKACPSDDPARNDWRLAVSTNATSARAAEVACREGLPFIDLRHALDAATNHGLGPDGVHLSAHRRGAGLLTREGLDCGYNIRTLVTLRALAQVVDVLDSGR